MILIMMDAIIMIIHDTSCCTYCCAIYKCFILQTEHVANTWLLKLVYGIDYLTDAEQVEATPVVQCLFCTGIRCAHVPDMPSPIKQKVLKTISHIMKIRVTEISWAAYNFPKPETVSTIPYIIPVHIFLVQIMYRPGYT